MSFLLLIFLGTRLLLDAHADPLPGLLYPRENEFREIKSLDGIWSFGISSPGGNAKSTDLSSYGYIFSKGVMEMPVPSSYNDITTSSEVRDHVGVVWYERTFYVPQSWSNQRVFLYFGSVNYLAQVWVNGQSSMSHEFGHLPFEAEITSLLKFGSKNRLTVAVDNTLSATTIPQGRTEEDINDGSTTYVQTHNFDFFNYAGIQRSVLLLTKPRVYVQDITVLSHLESKDNATLEYSVEIIGHSEHDKVNCSVALVDGETVVASATKSCKGNLTVLNPHLWWPRGMQYSPGYLYTFKVSVISEDSTELDTYNLPVGIRTLRSTNTSILINEKPVYFQGFGRHEDSPIRGRGHDIVTMTKDFELLKWIGANAFRTGHYPHSDEVLEAADRQGFLIIDECPATDLRNYSPELLEKHKKVMSELIRRDKNHPSVIMWSIANKPSSSRWESSDHFRDVAAHTKSLDPSRPITAALNEGTSSDRNGNSLDVIGFNRYTGWYTKPGRLGNIANAVVDEAHAWHQKYDKPVIMFEYGGDALSGYHEIPSFTWSEDYQNNMFSEHFRAFDRLRTENDTFFIGEFIPSLTDFRTAQDYPRAGGDKKGIFTRTRDPKMAANLVRKRYYKLAKVSTQTLEKLSPYFIKHGRFIERCPNSGYQAIFKKFRRIF